MGQRSQIFVRFVDNDKKELIARYYSWNFGERMISRARHTIDWIIEHRDYLSFEKNKISRILDTNFDMKDVVISSDIINEYIDDIKNEYYDADTSLNQYLFEMQDCNDGKLLLDVPEVGKIKYAFLNNNNELLSPEDYMEWDEGSSWKEPRSYRNKAVINTCIRNIKRICKIGKAMTYEEVKEFLEYNYSVENH